MLLLPLLLLLLLSHNLGNTFVVHPYQTCGLQQQRNCAVGKGGCSVLHVCIEFACIHVKIMQWVTRLDVCVSSLRWGHAKRIAITVQTS